ncbi:MAG: hypothetical protein KAT68_14670 [Bacteroidales bacterium]|nr:hypothetical protein [Bacteroidales bacterium]
MQGQRFIGSLEEFISNAEKDGAQIINQDERFMTMRMTLNQIDARITEEVVLLIDKKMNRLAGTRIYNSKDELLLSTLFGYGPPENPFLTAIKQESKELLPSGKEVAVESYTRIENINFKINI